MSRTVLVTGASSGIGRATAAHFAAEGWNVVATLRDPDRGAALDGRGNMLLARLDVTEPLSIDAAIADGIARFGRIDAVVNNAGYGQYGLLEAVPPEKMRAQFDVNVFGPMNVIRAILPHLRANGGGAIVNVSSGAGMFTLPMISMYCASKFALEGFSEALSYELASQNIAVKLVIPHGGVTGTRFGAVQFAEAASDPALTSYDGFIERTRVAFEKMMAARSLPAAEVAAVIYGAVTDGSDRLRYLVGDDARGFVKARRTLSEDDYIAFMRGHFR